jgi:hypothetical protein
VCGIVVDPLSDAEFKVIELLVRRWPGGASKSDLEKLGYSDPPKLLKRLRKRDPAWARAIVLPGKNYRRGYRLADDWLST